jgi:hypothetical protein
MKIKKSKGTAKYDWQEIKKNYLASDVIEAKEFLIRFLSVDPKTASGGSYAKATKGWRSEKEEMKKLQTVNAVVKMADDPEVEKFTKLLIQAKQNAVAKVSKLIGGNAVITERDIPNIAKGIEIINLELGLATSIAKIQGDKDNPLEVKVEVINWKL